MSYTVQKTLPTLEEIRAKLPLEPKLHDQIQKDRQEVRDILTGKNPRKILIIGPCSAWPSDAVIEYADRMAPLAKTYEDTIKIVMRTYIQKPRTTVGWMGPLVQPDPFAPVDIPTGIANCRQMMIEVVKRGLAISDEILFPRKESYFRDLFAWAAIGARSSENQEHRILASMLEFPIGLKNPTSGSISVGVNSVIAAQTPNYLALRGNQVQTSGNEYAHLVMRGGSGKPNISAEKMQKAMDLFAQKSIKNPSIIVDASHENSIDATGKKNPDRQPEVVFQTLDIAAENPGIAAGLKGWMMESFIAGGKQNLGTVKRSDDVVYGQSVTDGCLSWEQTEAFIAELVGRLR